MEHSMAEEKEGAGQASLDERAQRVLSSLEAEEPETALASEPQPADDDAAAEPPMSWSKEEKALFRQLPAELQSAVARREAERERHFSTRTQEAARLQKELEGERARVAAEFDALLAEAERDPVLLEGGRLDWDRLQRDNPALYARKWPAYRQRLAAIDAARANRAQLAQADEAARLEREHAALAARLPEWSDAERREKLKQELRGFLGEEGFAPGEIAAIGDHRAFLIALDAMRWRRDQEARKGLARKKVAAAPRVQKPGAAEEAPRGAERLAALKRKAARSGRLDDRAAYVLAALEE
jgi:hypothetical protein